ncbi:MAG: nuclear transport factor 2 family protein [Candidatus Nanopelagicales bacterium]
MDNTVDNTEDIVRRYFAVVGDLRSSEEDLRGVLHGDVRVVEHPNAITPRGATRDLAQTVAAFHAGKALLSNQAFDVHEVIAAGDRAAVRATWSGRVAVDAGPFHAGDVLTAEIAGFLMVREDRVLEHQTFDCYRPFRSSD